MAQYLQSRVRRAPMNAVNRGLVLSLPKQGIALR